MMRSEPSPIVISLGGGVQSSAMSLPESEGPFYVGRTWRSSP